MLDRDLPPEAPEPPGACAPIDPARMALQVFAELTQRGGTNAVADAEGVAAVSPALLSGLMRLLDSEGVSAGSVVRDALDQHLRERSETEGSAAENSTSPPGE